MLRHTITPLALGFSVSGLMIGTSAHLTEWSLGLTLAQAAVFTLSSRDDQRGWSAGIGLQPPWATYAVLTGQPAFLVTGAIITAANVGALRRHARR